jgi:GT2 family glycosyltransferase
VVTVKGQAYLNHGIYLRKALEDVGYINEEDYQFYCADVDLTLRIIEAGYTVEATDKALIEHCQHIATSAARQKNKDRYSQDAINFEQRWKDFLAGQRYREVGKRIESDIVPDDSTARKGFGMFFRRQQIIERLRYPITRLRNLFSEEDSA